MDNRPEQEKQPQEIVLEPLEDMIQTEEDLFNYRQELMAEAPWNAKRISIGQANWMMLFQAMAFYAIVVLFQKESLYQVSLINEILVVLLPGALFVWLSRRKPRKVYRLNPLPPKAIPLIIGMTLAIYPLGVMINALVLLGLGQFMELAAPIMPTAGTWRGYGEAILLICILPAICEEMMFRGIMLHAYEEEGSRYAILVTAVLFGLFHFSIQNFVGPFLLGIILGYFTIKTGSIYAAILAHFIHNFISNTIIHAMGLIHVVGGNNTALPHVEMIERKDLVIAFLAIGILVLVGLFIFITLGSKLKTLRLREEKKRPLQSQEAKVLVNQEFLLPPKDNIFEQVPIWLMGLMYILINIVRVIYTI